MKALSLFSGAGGASRGLLDAGCDVLASFEKDTDAVETLTLNGLNAVQADLNDYDWSPWRYTVDLVEGGPPCQPFSAAGRHLGKWDKRDCIPAFIRAIETIQPPIFVMENVRGLTYKKHAEYLATVVSRFERAGYVVEYRVLNAANFGVPQTRQRLFVVGRRDGVPIEWPEPTHAKNATGGLLPWVTMADALGWTPRTPRVVNTRGARRTPGGNDFDSTEKPSWAITEKTRSWKRKQQWPVIPNTISLQRRNNGAPPIDACVSPAPAVTVVGVGTGQWEVTWPHERPATTIAAGAAGAAGRVGRPGHKDWDSGEGQFQEEAVKITPEEAAILQDFDRSWKFAGSRSSQFRQIGNACPRRLTAAVVGAQIGSWPAQQRDDRQISLEEAA